MNSLSQYNGLLRRFPSFELSYETVSHKKVSVTSDSVAIAIPVGKKYFLWFTYQEQSCEDACYFLGLDKDRRVCSVEKIDIQRIPTRYCLGTVVYGTMYEPADSPRPVFVAEDIYQQKGTNLWNLCFGDRLGFLAEFIREKWDFPKMRAALPVMWHVKSGSPLDPFVPPDLAKLMAYSPHHIQYRSVEKVAPYINVPVQKRGAPAASAPLAVSSAQVAQKMTAASVLQPLPRFDYSKPTYRYPAVFSVMADPQLDLYHLYAYSDSRSRISDRANPQMVRSYGIPGTIDAGDRVVNATEDHYGGTGPVVYCGLAGIQSFRTSVFMNGIFRRIRENENLDLAEESEDEADFENTDMNKYVDLEKVALIECVFSQKHKKWIPVRLCGSVGEKMVHIEKLVSSGVDDKRNNGGHNRHTHRYERSSLTRK